LEVSIAENRDRKGLSPYEMATYIVRLVKDEGMTQQKVGKLLGVDRVVVNPLCKLPEYYEQLPKAWKRDLTWVDGDTVDGNADYKPAITLTHWRQVEPAIRKEGVTPTIKKALTAAAKEGWPVSRLVQEIRPAKKASKAKSADDVEPPADGETKDAGGGDESTSPTPGGPDYAGILTTLDNANKLAYGDEQACAVIATAIDAIKALQAPALAKVSPPSKDA
jgi:ParB-like chromosome segregation protein Spo0J